MEMKKATCATIGLLHADGWKWQDEIGEDAYLFQQLLRQV
jgi:hypothetical protein